jgi:hypothetical protein
MTLIYPIALGRPGMIGRPTSFPILPVGGPARTYAQILVEDFGASEVWPLVNIASGTTIPAFVNSARNGVLSGWALQNTPGPVPGTLAPFSDGTNDFGNIYSTGGGVGFADIFNGNIGAAFMWLKAAGAGVWSDGLARRGINWTVNTSNRILIQKPGTANTIQAFHFGGGVNKNVAHTISTTDWFSVGLSWNTGGGGELKVFVDGAQVGTTQTGLGAFTGTLGSTSTLIGSQEVAPSLVWHGWLGYAASRNGSIWTPTNFADMHAAAAAAGPD